MKIRIKFRKYGVMKFVGHLDMMRYFQKAIRRSGIDICYSQGYNPHQVMSFAAPLGVGATSDGEYLDIEVHTTKPTKESLMDLNKQMTEGIEVTGYVLLDDKSNAAMAAVTAADYEIWLRDGYSSTYKIAFLQEKLHSFFEEPSERLVTKKTKKGEKTIDLKKLVYAFSVSPQEHCPERPKFYLDVSAGSVENIKPELVLEAFYQYLGAEYDPLAFQIHRLDLYGMDEHGRRRPLLEEGTNING